LDKLARQLSSLGWLCKNPNTSEDTLRFLYYEAKLAEGDRERIASHPNVPLDVLGIMVARSRDPKLHVAVARNKKTPADILRLLVKNGDTYVQGEARKHPNYPQK